MSVQAYRTFLLGYEYMSLCSRLFKVSSSPEAWEFYIKNHKSTIYIKSHKNYYITDSAYKLRNHLIPSCMSNLQFFDFHKFLL